MKPQGIIQIDTILLGDNCAKEAQNIDDYEILRYRWGIIHFNTFYKKRVKVHIFLHTISKNGDIKYFFRFFNEIHTAINDCELEK